MKSGFSLVELSIVLVILGLLTGGILAGQSLIRAAEIRSVSNDFQKYQAAIYSFRDKYFAMPGDMRDATKFWGFAGGSTTGLDNTCYNVFKTDLLTCNGNGNGFIDDTAVMGTHQHAERFLVWQHLANAGLIEGSYTGRTNDVSAFTISIGRNVPPSRAGNGVFNDLYGWMGILPSTWYADMQAPSNNRLTIFGPSSANYAAMRPEETWNLDTKMDDGKPGTGRFLHYKATSAVAPGCVTSDSAPTAEYVLTNSSILCAPTLKIN